MHATLTSTAFTIPAGLSNMNRQTSADDHGRDRPRQQHRRADEAAPARHAVHRQRQREAEHQLERHGDRGRSITVCAERAPEPRIAERLDVVGGADEGPAEPGHPQIVQVQRFPDRPQRSGTARPEQ